MRALDWQDEVEQPREAASPRAEARALQELRALYRQADAAFAPYSCPASGECCQLARTGRQPWLWAPEWRLLARHGLPPSRPDGACPYLDAAGRRCTVYADRPLGCRTFFCERVRGPSRQPTQQMDALLRRLRHVSERLESSPGGPRPLLQWHAEALAGALAAPPLEKPAP